MPIAAVTGGTGFFGRYIITALAEAGFSTRLLTRRAPLAGLPAVPHDLVPGDLADPDALARLVTGATVIIHAAGLVKACRRRDFFTVNETGTRNLAEAAARHAPRARVILISSQAARAPHLSAYAASKRAGEAALTTVLSTNPWIILRPAIIYGPGDIEGRALFRLASGRLAPILARPEPRLAMIHAGDAAAAVAAFATAGLANATFELTDAAAEGHSLTELLQATGAAINHTPRLVPIPDLLLRAAALAAAATAALTNRPTLFGPGKARELIHRDWRPDPTRRPPETLWTPTIPLPAGLAETAAWWRATNLITSY